MSHQVVDRYEGDYPGGGPELEPQLVAPGDGGQGAKVEYVEDELAKVAEEEGEDEEDQDAGQLVLALAAASAGGGVGGHRGDDGGVAVAGGGRVVVLCGCGMKARMIEGN